MESLKNGIKKLLISSCEIIDEKETENIFFIINNMTKTTKITIIKQIFNIFIGLKINN